MWRITRAKLSSACIAMATPTQMRCRVVGRVGALAQHKEAVEWTAETARVSLQRAQRALVRVRRLSQRSLHNAPIFRLLLKVAVKGTHQCDFFNFCGAHGPNKSISGARLSPTGVFMPMPVFMRRRGGVTTRPCAHVCARLFASLVHALRRCVALRACERVCVRVCVRVRVRVCGHGCGLCACVCARVRGGGCGRLRR